MSTGDMTGRAHALAEAFDREFAAPPPLHADESAKALAIRVGGEPYILSIDGLASVSKRQRIVALPGGSPSQLGLSGIGGRLVAVFSLPSLLGYDVSLSEISWLAVVSGRAVALAFERLEGQIAMLPSSVSAAPRDAGRHVAGVVRAPSDTAVRGLLDLGSLLARLDEQGV